MPGDYAKHGFSQGCPGCTWAQNQIGPRRRQSEACRRRLEEEIGKDASDTRAEKVKERNDHYAATEVKEGDDQERDAPRQDNEDEPIKEVEGDNANDDQLDDAPKRKSEARCKTPDKGKATKRRSIIHEEEPDTKRIILDDDEMEPENNDQNDGIDIDSIEAKRIDQDIMFRASIGHDLSEVYSNKRI